VTRWCTLHTNVAARLAGVSERRSDRKQTLLFARRDLLREISVFAKQLLCLSQERAPNPATPWRIVSLPHCLADDFMQLNPASPALMRQIL